MIANKEKGQARVQLPSQSEGGQALLVVVLVMVVTLTVGLSLTSRSIVNVRTSTEEADSQKALAAAEAGIEQALQIYNTATIGGPFIENKSIYSAKITEVEGKTLLANGGNLVLQDDGIDIWLVSHDANGKPNYSTPWDGKNLNIYWGDQSLDDWDNAAIEIVVISGPEASPSLKRHVYDPWNLRADTNKFSKVSLSGKAGYTIEGKKFKYKEELKGDNKISSGLVVRVIPIYASTAIAVDGDGDDLPTQGFKIDSTGTAGTGDREVKRSLNFFRTYGQLPIPYFMYGLFSP